jgi:hypothetical protein
MMPINGFSSSSKELYTKEKTMANKKNYHVKSLLQKTKRG